MSAEVAHVEFMDANGATIDTLPPGLQRIQGVWAKQVGDQVTLLLRLAADAPLSVTAADSQLPAVQPSAWPRLQP